MKNKVLTVIGTNHQKAMSRIWIEGKWLVWAGFTVGTRYDRHVNKEAGLIQLVTMGNGKYKVSGKGDKPIIDTSGKVVREVFPDTGDDTARQVVEVVYERGKITIQRPEEVKP